jgi:16S rRNA (adenine1518-N6/adenine1519-N6)-dimethyltransferase
MVKPLKKFGQNYLVDKNIVHKIIDEINPQKEELILEIGPGQGALTKELYLKCDNFLAVEIDRRVIENLETGFAGIKIISGDFLKTSLKEIAGNKKIRIAGNIPYNITSPILFKLIEEREFVQDAVLMVQHEVAKRLTAEKRTKDYGILRIILSCFADVKYCFKVSPNVFFPKPNVDSAVVHLMFKETIDDTLDTGLFMKIVKAAFGNRRKTLKNSFSNSIFGAGIFEGSGLDLTKRAEELDLDDYIRVTKFVQSKLDTSSLATEPYEKI